MTFVVLPLIENYEAALTIRWEVLQKEQGLAETLDFDGEDETLSTLSLTMKMMTQ